MSCLSSFCPKCAGLHKEGPEDCPVTDVKDRIHLLREWKDKNSLARENFKRDIQKDLRKIYRRFKRYVQVYRLHKKLGISRAYLSKLRIKV
jgi:hypothetical protein